MSDNRVSAGYDPDAINWSTLKVGDSGSDVHVLQALLGVRWLTQTGKFDDTTEYLVKAFQMSAGLYPDGIVRGDTWAALTKRA